MALVRFFEACLRKEAENIELDYYAMLMAERLKVSPNQYRQIPVKVLRYAVTCCKSDCFLIALIICRLMKKGYARVKIRKAPCCYFRLYSRSINRLRDAGIFYSLPGYANGSNKMQETLSGKRFSLDFPPEYNK